MATDRAADRHAEGSRHQITVPPDQWEALARVVGKGNCSAQIRDLIAAFVARRRLTPAGPDWAAAIKLLEERNLRPEDFTAACVAAVLATPDSMLKSLARFMPTR